MQDLFNPYPETDTINQDSNGKAMIRKGSWRKALKTQNRDV
jgi:hypothetical protein